VWELYPEMYYFLFLLAIKHFLRPPSSSKRNGTGGREEGNERGTRGEKGETG